MGLSSFKLLLWAPYNNITLLILQEWHFGRSRSSKVIDFGTNWKRICDFLLLRHSNFGPTCILHCFCAPDPTPYSTLILEVFPLDQVAYFGVSPTTCLKLISRKIIFEVFQGM